VSLKEMLEGAREQVARTVLLIRDLTQVATELGMQEVAAQLHQFETSVTSETFRIGVVGRFKNGKSTITNALLGKVTHPVPELPPGNGPMPTDDLPCTATLVRVCYAERPHVHAKLKNGDVEPWTLSDFLERSTIKETETETRRFFDRIREFELAFPAEICTCNVSVIDSPGLDDVAERTAITRDAIADCDAAVVVYRHEPFAGEGEREFVQRQVTDTGTRMFTIVNRWNGRKVDRRLEALVWGRLVEEPGGHPFRDQALASKDIYFVDGLSAERGKLTGDARLVEESGFGVFERRLGAFLLKERQKTKLDKWIRVTIQRAEVMKQQNARLRQTHQAEIRNSEEQIRAIRSTLGAAHTQRDRLPNLFDRCERQCQRELRTSFRATIDHLRSSLPEALSAATLPSMQTKMDLVFGQFQQEKVTREALEFCNRVVSTRVDEWSRDPCDINGAQQALRPVLEDLFEEVRHEVSEIERALEEVQFALTGWAPRTGPIGSLTSMTERVLTGAAGLAFGDFATLLGGGGGGWRAMAGSFAAQIGTGIGLSILGLAGTVVFWPAIFVAAIVGSLFGGSLGLEERIKRTALVAVDRGVDGKEKPLLNDAGERVRGLIHAADDAAPMIDRHVTRLFQKLKKDVMEKLAQEIAIEERNIQQSIEFAQSTAAERSRWLAKLDAADERIVRDRAELNQVLDDVAIASP